MLTADQSIKRLVINFFDLFPTRIHALTHIFFDSGNGYEWACDPNGKYHISEITPPGDHESIAVMSDWSKPIKAALGPKKGLGLENVIRGWINENIDTYLEPNFIFAGINLNPTELDRELNTDALAFNLPIDICEDWKDALTEITSYYITLMTPNECRAGSSEAIDYIEYKSSINKNNYLALLSVDRELQNVSSINKSINISFGNLLSYNEFNSIKLFIDNSGKDTSIHAEVRRFVETRERFFTEKLYSPNDALVSEIKNYIDNPRGLDNSTLNDKLKDELTNVTGFINTDIESITDLFMSKLDICELFRPQIKYALNSIITEKNLPKKISKPSS